MPKVSVEEFLELAQTHPVLDVRSPGEYEHAHIPGAHCLPLFTDEERKVVGTSYKQKSREDAIKIGLDYFGPKMRKMVEEAEELLKKRNSKKKSTEVEDKWVLVHCWRGGMRSSAVAWLLELYGFKVYLLAGGYKAYRKWVLAQFEVKYPIVVVGGYTGSGKTEVLHAMSKKGNIVLDLEAIANHKGSAFGGIGTVQPGQEMFENLLATRLAEAAARVTPGDCIWVEDESRRIGGVNLPGALWENMRTANLCFFEIPFEARLDFITSNYGKLPLEHLINATVRIKKRLGNEGAKRAINFMLEGNYRDAFAILLRYYDKYYGDSLKLRENYEALTTVISAENVDPVRNSRVLDELKKAT